MIFRKDMEFKHGKMDQDIKGNIKMVKNRGKVDIIGKMDQVMKEIGLIIN